MRHLTFLTAVAITLPLFSCQSSTQTVSNNQEFNHKEFKTLKVKLNSSAKGSILISDLITKKLETFTTEAATGAMTETETVSLEGTITEVTPPELLLENAVLRVVTVVYVADPGQIVTGINNTVIYVCEGSSWRHNRG